MKPKLPQISDSEWRVMQVLWQKGPQTASEVVDALSGQVKWNPRTVKTLISRLVKKRAVKVIDGNYRYRYSAAVTESACVRSETKSFVQRVFQGAKKPALAAFLEDTELSPEEIDDLQALLDQKRKE
jgi:BlaI family penicillinase repressor